jgi:hypothetical protein
MVVCLTLTDTQPESVTHRILSVLDREDRVARNKPAKVMNALGRLLIVAAIASLHFSQPAIAEEQDSTADPQTTSSSRTKPANPNTDAGSHFSLSPYLWFAGAHGTVGALGRDASLHASPGDLLSHFNFGLMGAAEFRRNRFLLNGDLLWIRLSDSRALPLPPVIGAVSTDVRVGQLVWTSKVGYRVIDRKKLKADANLGVRFWHLGQKLNFYPSPLGRSVNTSQNWADIVIGGHVQLPVGEKAVVHLLGDVGGWNATAKLDYQFATLLGYKLRPKWTLEAGYRYLFVNYHGGNAFLYSVVTSGALIGATYQIK